MLNSGFAFRFPGSLQITETEASDQAKYECVASNSVGTEYSKATMLYVKSELALYIIPPFLDILLIPLETMNTSWYLRYSKFLFHPQCVLQERLDWKMIFVQENESNIESCYCQSLFICDNSIRGILNNSIANYILEYWLNLFIRMI